MKAVVKITGKQYLVSEGDILDVDKMVAESEENLDMDEVLLLISDKDVLVGQPYVSGAKIKASVLKQFKGKKIRVARFKSKVRYRRVKGFRPQLTQIKIDKIILPKTSK